MFWEIFKFWAFFCTFEIGFGHNPSATSSPLFSSSMAPFAAFHCAPCKGRLAYSCFASCVGSKVAVPIKKTSHLSLFFLPFAAVFSGMSLLVTTLRPRDAVIPEGGRGVAPVAFGSAACSADVIGILRQRDIQPPPMTTRGRSSWREGDSFLLQRPHGRPEKPTASCFDHFSKAHSCGVLGQLSVTVPIRSPGNKPTTVSFGFLSYFEGYLLPMQGFKLRKIFTQVFSRNLGFTTFLSQCHKGLRFCYLRFSLFLPHRVSGSPFGSATVWHNVTVSLSAQLSAIPFGGFHSQHSPRRGSHARYPIDIIFGQRAFLTTMLLEDRKNVPYEFCVTHTRIMQDTKCHSSGNFSFVFAVPQFISGFASTGFSSQGAVCRSFGIGILPPWGTSAASSVQAPPTQAMPHATATTSTKAFLLPLFPHCLWFRVKGSHKRVNFMHNSTAHASAYRCNFTMQFCTTTMCACFSICLGTGLRRLQRDVWHSLFTPDEDRILETRGRLFRLEGGSVEKRFPV